MPTDIKHILFVSRSLPFHRLGGMEIIAWDLAKQFAKDGYRITFLTTTLVDQPECFMTEGVNVIAVKHTIPGEYSRSWWKNSRDYFNDYLKDDVDLIFSVSAAGYGLMHSKQALNIPFIFQAHGTAIGEIRSKWKTFSFLSILGSIRNVYGLLRDCYYYPKCDAIVAVGGAVFNEIKIFPYPYFIRSQQCHLIQNGVDKATFKYDQLARDRIRKKLGLTEKNRVVITASRLHAQKGIVYALCAFAEYAKRDREAFYLIIGEGKQRKNLEKLAQAKNIHHQVIFVGSLSRNDVANYLAAADLFLFTTLRIEAGLPLNILEALSTGLPVVLSIHLKGLLDVKEGVYYIEPDQPQMIAYTIDQALSRSKGYRETKLPESGTLSVCAKAYYRVFDILLK